MLNSIFRFLKSAVYLFAVSAVLGFIAGIVWGAATAAFRIIVRSSWLC
jgi:hypothetical protein